MCSRSRPNIHSLASRLCFQAPLSWFPNNNSAGGFSISPQRSSGTRDQTCVLCVSLPQADGLFANCRLSETHASHTSRFLWVAQRVASTAVQNGLSGSEDSPGRTKKYNTPVFSSGKSGRRTCYTYRVKFCVLRNNNITTDKMQHSYFMPCH